MKSYTDRAQVRAAARDPALDPHLRAVLRLRYEQLGGEGAHFHVAGAADGPAEAEAAAGWPLAIDGEPQWEWTERHPGGWTEVVLVLSDGGPAQVLLLPDGSPAADLVREVEAQHADG